MRTLQVVLSAISTVLAAFSLISWFWIYNAGKFASDAASSVSFHAGLVILTAAFVLATTIITLLRKK